jgi:hypothetical protein
VKNIKALFFLCDFNDQNKGGNFFSFQTSLFIAQTFCQALMKQKMEVWGKKKGN